jgi:AGZA family xanthine/uracil permease-like MFS transporter
MLERWFGIRAAGSSVRTEVVGGLTTFMTMAYIIFVQPLILGAAGMDVGAVMVATCLASALATLFMAFLANYPIALAPGMGPNVFFTYTVVLGLGFTWQQALGATFLSGALFVLLSTVGFREKIIHSLPTNLKHAIAVGIGLMIAVVGLEWSGIVVDHPATLVSLGQLGSPPTLLSLFGLVLTASLFARGVKGALLLGILVNAAVALATGMVEYHGLIGPVPSLAPTFLELDLLGALRPEMIAVVFVFFFLDLFDTVGTLTGVSQKAGFLRPDGTLPGARQALLADALGTVAGSLVGTSTVTSYVESAAGVASGARTGLANLVTAGLFLLALFFSPLLQTVGGGIGGEGLRLYPVISPALIVVGCFMLSGIREIHWDDYSEAFPAFLTIVIMPLTFSITEGIAFGFIAYTLLKAVTGRFREVPWLIRVFAALFVVRHLVS